MNPHGIYTLVSRGNTLDRKMETLANNLANVSTIGYKEDQPAFQQLFSTTMGVASESDEESFAHHEHLAPYTGVGTFYVSTADMGKNFAQGRLIRTGNALDFSVVGDQGFFSIDTPQGERFTRAGNFQLNQNGQLVTQDGYVVNGKEGPLNLKGDKIEMVEDGSLLVDGKPAGGLKLVSFATPEHLQKMGGNYFAPVSEENAPRVLEDVKLIQGSVEGSNVDTMKEMVRMIEANRAYTQAQKAIRSADEMNRQAISLAQV